MRFEDSTFHFIGIGGVGMSGLAELLANLGARVTGSDQVESATIERLRKIGINVYIGHQGENVGEVDVVVFSSAIPISNPEMGAALSKKIPIIPRAEVLAEIMRLKRGVAVAGTHGKTTTTSLISTIFIDQGLDPTVVVGGRLDVIKSNAKLGAGDWLIAEADESDRSFLKLSPEVAVITNIDTDHLDFYDDFDDLKQAFFEFAEKIPFYGFAIICGDDPNIRDLFREYKKRAITYGFEPHNDFRLGKQGDKYRVHRDGKFLGDFSPGLPGRHNALNSLAAIIAGLAGGIEFQKACESLSKFSGVGRRFEHIGKTKGVDFFDDYGHHPTEIRAVVSAFAETYPQRQLYVVFQPHRFSRTQLCWAEFLQCFQGAHKTCLLDVYPASEKPIEGIDSSRLADEMSAGNPSYYSDRSQLKQYLREHLRKGDIVVTLGAGDITTLGADIMDFLNDQ